MLAAVHRREALLELGYLGPRQLAPLAAAKRAEKALFIGATEDRPNGKRAGAYWRTAKESEGL